MPVNYSTVFSPQTLRVPVWKQFLVKSRVALLYVIRICTGESTSN